MPSGIFAQHTKGAPTATAHNVAIFTTVKKDMVFMCGIVPKNLTGRKEATTLVPSPIKKLLLRRAPRQGLIRLCGAERPACSSGEFSFPVFGVIFA
ncbi:MAG: hypothetical protein IJ146_12855, partial [Kiritimatiellae bacterium]|nr:hypothetical protein [Kiritimatiellia bacterium]